MANQLYFYRKLIQPKKVEKLFEYQWGGKILFSHGTYSSNGVRICFRYNLDYNISAFICDKNSTSLQEWRYKASLMF